MFYVRQSDMVDRRLKVGGFMPTFRLPNATGQTVTVSALLAKSPLVVTFYLTGAAGDRIAL
jgi:peroxiredoxin